MAACFVLFLAVGCSGELVPTNPEGGGDPDGAAPDDVTAFRPGIQGDLDSLGCIVAACHGGGDAVPMLLVANPLANVEWEQNYNQVMARAGTTATSLLIDKATGAGGHTASVDVAHPMVERWRHWIEMGTPYQATAGTSDAGPAGPDGGSQGPADAADALSWDDDIGPLMVTAGCAACHGNDGAYSVETYSAAFGFGSDDTPNVVPGDPLSALAVYCEQGHFDMPYADTLTVISWIVDFDARER